MINFENTQINDWIDNEDEKLISSLDTRSRQEYVQIMQTILDTFEVRHPSFIGEGITEIGNESIHLKDLIPNLVKMRVRYFLKNLYHHGN
jgi:hypothetical protein